jgi:hypothetical protein
MFVERGDAQSPDAALVHQPLELANAAHAVERAHRRQPDEALGIGFRDARARSDRRADEDADLDPGLVHVRHQPGDQLVGVFGDGGRLLLGAPLENALVVGETVAFRPRQAVGDRIAGAALRRLLVGRVVHADRQVAFEVDHTGHF